MATITEQRNIKCMGHMAIGGGGIDANAPLNLVSRTRYMFPMMSDPAYNTSHHSELYYGFMPGGPYNAIAWDFVFNAADDPTNYLSLHMYGDDAGSGLAIFGAGGGGSNVAIGKNGAPPKAKLHASVSTILGAATAPVADGDLAAGEVNVWLDESGNKLMFKAKYSNGVTIKSGSISLI